MLVGQLLLDSGVWQDCQSLPTRTLLQELIDPHVGKRSHHDPHSSIFHSRRELGEPFLGIHDFPYVCGLTRTIWLCGALIHNFGP